MNVIEESFRRLYPEKQFEYYCSIKYSAKFKPFNANIKSFVKIHEDCQQNPDAAPLATQPPRHDEFAEGAMEARII